MFADLKTIEHEINQFKTNMNSVDGLMFAVKDVCSKMDQQIHQGNQFIDHLGKIQIESKERLNQIQQEFEIRQKEFQISNCNLIQGVNNDLIKSIQHFNLAIDKIQQMVQSQLTEVKESNQQDYKKMQNQADRFQQEHVAKIESLNQQIEKLVAKQNYIQQSLEAQLIEANTKASKTEKRLKQLSLEIGIGLLLLAILIIVL